MISTFLQGQEGYKQVAFMYQMEVGAITYVLQYVKWWKVLRRKIKQKEGVGNGSIYKKHSWKTLVEMTLNLGEKRIKGETLDSQVWAWMPSENFGCIVLIVITVWLQTRQ